MSRRSVRTDSTMSRASSSVSSGLNRYRKIIIMGVDYHEQDNDSYFWIVVRCLQQQRHNVTIVRNNNMTSRFASLLSASYIQIGSWIPRTIWGYMKPMMYIMRSLYSALWVSFNFRNPANAIDHTIVISDASYVAVPILRSVGRFIVISLECYKELLSYMELYNDDIPYLERCCMPLRNYCISFANRIVLPCPGARELLQFENQDGESYINVIYPPAEGEFLNRSNIHSAAEANRLRPSRSRRNYVMDPPSTALSLFVASDVFEARSNFHLLIDAFVYAAGHLDVALQQQLTLDIIGFCYNPRQEEYLDYLQRQVATAHTEIIARIRLHVNLDFETRCSFYRRAFAVLNANHTALFVPSILEAFYHGRLVISLGSDFVDTLVRNGISGIVLSEEDANTEHFGQHIVDILLQHDPNYRFMAMEGTNEYDRYYSYECLASRLRELINSIE